jgi:hypothetical protein
MTKINAVRNIYTYTSRYPITLYLKKLKIINTEYDSEVNLINSWVDGSSVRDFNKANTRKLTNIEYRKLIYFSRQFPV